MAKISSLIAVADATATVFTFSSPRERVAVAIVFYDTNGAVLTGSGTRDIAISHVAAASGSDINLTGAITGATQSAQPERAWKAFNLGFPTSMISIACAAATTPGSATHYRIWVEA